MQEAKSNTSDVDLQLREEPACVKNVPRKVPEKPVLGLAPLCPLGVPLSLRGESLGVGPCSSCQGPSYSRLLTRRFWCCRRRGQWVSLRRSTPLTLLLYGSAVLSVSTANHVLPPLRIASDKANSFSNHAEAVSGAVQK